MMMDYYHYPYNDEKERSIIISTKVAGVGRPRLGPCMQGTPLVGWAALGPGAGRRLVPLLAAQLSTLTEKREVSLSLLGLLV